MSLDENEPEWMVGGFWEGDNYKKVVRRVEDGFQFCYDISKMLQERAEIEMKYSQKLQMWSSKWGEFIEKSNEYGTTKNVLIHSLCEADSVSGMHTDIRDQLQKLLSEVKKWKNESYTKQVVGLCKEAKNYDDEFKKAQKPWARLDGKMTKYIKELEVLEKTIKELFTTSKGDETEDKKMVEKLRKCQNERIVIEDKMTKVKKEMVTYRTIYIGDMTGIFEKSQAFELKRLEFIKSSLFKLHACLDVSQNNQLAQVFPKWRKMIETIDPTHDISFWSLQNAVHEVTTEKSKPNEKKHRLSFRKSKKEKMAPDIPHEQPSATHKPQRYDQALNPFGSNEDVAVVDNTSLDLAISEDSKSLDEKSNFGSKILHKPNDNAIPFGSKHDPKDLPTVPKPSHTPSTIPPNPEHAVLNESTASNDSLSISLKSSNNSLNDVRVTADKETSDRPSSTLGPSDVSALKVDEELPEVSVGESSSPPSNINTPNAERKSVHRSKRIEDYNPDLNPFGD